MQEKFMKATLHRWIVVLPIGIALFLSAVWFRFAAAQTSAEKRTQDSNGNLPLGSPDLPFRQGVTSHIGQNERTAEHQALSEQEAETLRLIAAYRESESDKERDAIAADLSKAIATQFDLRQAARDRELKQLEEQLRKLRELHEKRAGQKNRIIEDRVRQLLRDADGLGWGTDEAAVGNERLWQSSIRPPAGKQMQNMMGRQMQKR
jgi:hypothetical protein